jgi:hypothetical protein
MTIELLARIRDTVVDALFFALRPGTVEQAGDALQEVTRWAWLPALSGIAIAGDHARTSHETAVGGSVK